jgi:glycerol-3-phosphate acyltransferase PlsY
MLPLEALIGFAFWALIAKTVKISVLSSMSGLVGALVASYFIHPGLGAINSQIPLILISFIIFYKHIPNFVRLIQGEEKRVL